MIDFVFGLHLYQPPNQEPQILERITKESYLPVIDLILSHPKAFLVIDLARSAIENLEKQGLGRSFLEKIKIASALKKISLTNTAAYHPILPLLPKREIKRQVLLNEESYKVLFGDFYQKPEGFFPPEMAFSQKLVSIFEELGYRWLITGDTPFVCRYRLNPPFNLIPAQKNVAIFLRSDFWSNRIASGSLSGKEFSSNLKKELNEWFGRNRGYLIVWVDWETFGHHWPNFVEKFLAPFFDSLNQEINLCSNSDLLSRYSQREIIIPPGSWSTTAEDFGKKNYWPLWKNPKEEFHRLWWELAKITLEIKKGINSQNQLSLFDKCLYSCQTWQWSQGNKTLAIKGKEYFKEIVGLKEAEPYRRRIRQIIERLESLCS